MNEAHIVESQEEDEVRELTAEEQAEVVGAIAMEANILN